MILIMSLPRQNRIRGPSDPGVVSGAALVLYSLLNRRLRRGEPMWRKVWTGDGTG